MINCRVCGHEIEDKFDDNFNLDHTVVWCPECGNKTFVDYERSEGKDEAKN